MSPSADHLQLQVCGLSHVGRVRSENQDAFCVADLTRADTDDWIQLAGPDAPSPGHSPDDLPCATLQIPPRGLLLLVADGMGGAAGGAEASGRATSLIPRTLRDRWLDSSPASEETFVAHLMASIQDANLQIHEQAARDPDLAGMGTTVTAAGVLDDTVYLAQVGDSRAYLIREGKAVQITRDQSMVQELVEKGAMTRDQAERSVHRSVLLQAVGTEPHVQVAVTFHPLRRGDHLLLCSDGLSGPVGDHELAEIVRSAESPSHACRRLVALANERGGPDNITVVLALAEGDGFPQPSADDAVQRRVFDVNRD